jgi:hypothetical protein
MPPQDREDLQRFIDEFSDLMRELTDETHPDLLSPARRGDLADAFRDAGEAFAAVGRELGRPDIERQPRTPPSPSLEDAGLLGANRERKTRGWRRALDRFRSWPTRKSLSRVFRWANMLLESLAAVVPPAQALKEFKQYAENLNADAMEDAAADPGKGPG